MSEVQEKIEFDVFVVGGGINGVGIAVDCAGRGLTVGLCEKNDLAGATSSASSKLIHGGLRYLEQYEFRLVKESLAEREVLLKMAPHIAWPLRFCLPHRPQLRPAWMIRTGLFLYDHLSSRVSLKGSESITFNENSPLLPEFKKGFEYSDGWIDDARLVVLNAMELQRLQGQVLTRTEAVSAKRESNCWKVSLKDNVTGRCWTIRCKALVNAGGPWVQTFLESGLKQQSPRTIRLIKGSHIIVPKLHNESRAYILQNQDGRITFVIPWLDHFSLIGTTDIEYTGNPNCVSCSEEEKNYLCEVVNQHFHKTITVKDIVWSYAGVRPLCEDESSSPQAITRDYTIELQDSGNGVPLLSVFGGKLTTYRKLAEAAVVKLSDYFPGITAPWTAENVLPGGEGFESIALFSRQLLISYSWLSDTLAVRYSRQYGSLSFRLLENVQCIDDMGQHFGADLYAVEVDYLIMNEWAYQLDDIIWRRSKLGIFLTRAEKGLLNDYLEYRLPQLVPERFGPSSAIYQKVG